MRKVINFLLKKFINFIFPAQCLICGKLIEEDAVLCKDCFNDITLIRPPYCYKCGRPLDGEIFKGAKEPLCLDCRRMRHYFAMARSAGVYAGALKKCIYLFKYKGKKVILRQLKALFVDALKAAMPLDKISLIIPVPLHKKGLFKREFNQSALLAEMAASFSGIPVEENNLTKTKVTPSQTTLTRVKRLGNVKNTFMLKRPQHVRDKGILLIDDVYTTGSTVDECSRVLKKAQAKEVYVFTLAHGQ